MFSAQGVALNVTTASLQLRMLYNSAYLSAWLKLRGTNSRWIQRVTGATETWWGWEEEAAAEKSMKEASCILLGSI
jgi:hypothetical protein